MIAVDAEHTATVTAVVYDLALNVGDALGSLAVQDALPGLAERFDQQPYPWPYEPHDLGRALAVAQAAAALVGDVVRLVEDMARAAGVDAVALPTLAEVAATEGEQ